MQSDNDYLIIRRKASGWEITQQGRRIVSTRNVVAAIEFANCLSEYDSTVKDKKNRVVLIDQPPPARRDE